MIKIYYLILSTLLFIQPLHSNEEEIFKSMEDEIDRSLDSLSLKGLQEPYYIEYKISKNFPSSIKSSNGSVTQVNTDTISLLSVGVRVGNYDFDNTNYFDVGLGFFGSSDDEESFTKRQIANDIGYDYLRRELWLATDAAYKRAAEIYSKKEASLKNRVRKDTIPDFIKVTGESNQKIKKIPNFNTDDYKDLINKVSEVFNSFPEIYKSSVSIEFLPKKLYYLNSEGSKYVKDSYYTGLEIVAATQDTNGLPIFDHYSEFVQNPSNLSDVNKLIDEAKKLARNLLETKKSKTPDDYYVGPVLYKGQAAAEIFAQCFAPNFIAQREPMSEGGFSTGGKEYKAFQRKIGGRVLPKFLSVYDKPLIEKHNNSFLMGHYELDDDGVPAENIKLVNEGYLETLLSERIPTRRIKESNGHNRGGAAMYSNLFIESKKENALSPDKIEEKMSEILERRELDYGIVIEKILNQNIRYTTLYRIVNGNMEIPFGNDLYIMDGYKLYKDGRRESFKGMKVPKINVLSFKDIINVSEERTVHNFLTPSVISPYITGGDQYLGCSIIIPDLLFEDGEVHIIEDDFKRTPYVPNPLSLQK